MEGNVTFIRFIDNVTSPSTAQSLQMPYKDIADNFAICMRCVSMIICIVGMATNAITMRAFLRIGLDDTVTISFFLLAFVDLANCFFGIFEGAFQFFDSIETFSSIRFKPIVFIIGYLNVRVRMVFTTEATLIKIYLAIQRCLCVVLPFQVKSLFTNKRTYIFIGISFLYSLLTAVLYAISFQFLTFVEPNTNLTRVQFSPRPGFEGMILYIHFGMGTVFNLATMIVVVICLIFMIVALNKSAKFKKKLTSTNSTVKSPKDDAPVQEVVSRERQALIQVMVVSAIFVATYVSYLAYGIPTMVIPGFGLYKRLYYVLVIIYQFSTSGDYINSTVNLFVYYKFNTKFREHCFQTKKS